MLSTVSGIFIRQNPDPTSAVCQACAGGRDSQSREDRDSLNKEITKRRVPGHDTSCSFSAYGVSTAGSTLIWAVGHAENKIYKNKNNLKRNNPAAAPMELTLRRGTDSKQNSV